MKRNRLGMRLGLTLVALGILCTNSRCGDGLVSDPLTGSTGDLNATIERIVYKMGINGGTTPITDEPQQHLVGDGPVFETLPR